MASLLSRPTQAEGEEERGDASRQRCRTDPDDEQRDRATRVRQPRSPPSPGRYPAPAGATRDRCPRGGECRGEVGDAGNHRVPADDGGEDEERLARPEHGNDSGDDRDGAERDVQPTPIVSCALTTSSITPPRMNPMPKNTATAHTVVKLNDRTTQPKPIHRRPATRYNHHPLETSMRSSTSAIGSVIAAPFAVEPTEILFQRAPRQRLPCRRPGGKVQQPLTRLTCSSTARSARPPGCRRRTPRAGIRPCRRCRGSNPRREEVAVGHRADEHMLLDESSGNSGRRTPSMRRSGTFERSRAKPGSDASNGRSCSVRLIHSTEPGADES